MFGDVDGDGQLEAVFATMRWERAPHVCEGANGGWAAAADAVPLNGMVAHDAAPPVGAVLSADTRPHRVIIPRFRSGHVHVVRAATGESVGPFPFRVSSAQGACCRAQCAALCYPTIV